MYRRLVEASDSMPVTLDEIKLHLRITDPVGESPPADNPEDPLLEAFIATAVEEAEAITCRKLRESVWRIYGQADTVLPLHDLDPVVSVAGPYYQNAGTETLVAGNITLEHDKAVPETVTLSALPSETDWYVKVSCGYDDASLIPGPIKTWIKMRVGVYYENRESYKTGTIATPMDFVPQLLLPYRNRTVF